MRSLIAASFLTLFFPSLVAACPMAGKSYDVRFETWLRTVLTFDESCSEVTQTYQGYVTKHPLKETADGWMFPDGDGASRWEISSTGKSVRLMTQEWSVRGRMRPVRKK